MIICKRCLLSEIDTEDVKKAIDQMIQAMPEEQKADEETYNYRLSKCKQCDSLNSGMCGKCGCYVELRALKKNQKCPHEIKKW